LLLIAQLKIMLFLLTFKSRANSLLSLRSLSLCQRW